MFNIKLKFASDTLLMGFNMKIENENIVIDPKTKTRYEIYDPISLEKDKYSICNYPLHKL